jgi:hypothetical protein
MEQLPRGRGEKRNNSPQRRKGRKEKINFYNHVGRVSPKGVTRHVSAFSIHHWDDFIIDIPLRSLRLCGDYFFLCVLCVSAVRFLLYHQQNEHWP